MAAYDLAALWEADCRYEFETRDVDATCPPWWRGLREPHPHHDRWRRLRELATFLRAPFHRGRTLPTSTSSPSAARSGEFPCRRVHRPLHAHHSVDYMPPGIEPTGRAVEIPTVAIVQFQEDKLVHEHIDWDASDACSFNSDCSIPTAFPSLGPRPRAKCSTFPCPATH